MPNKNACALEFACILGRNIKCSVIIIIARVVSLIAQSLADRLELVNLPLGSLRDASVVDDVLRKDKIGKVR